MIINIDLNQFRQVPMLGQATFRDFTVNHITNQKEDFNYKAMNPHNLSRNQNKMHAQRMINREKCFSFLFAKHFFSCELMLVFGDFSFIMSS